MTIRGQSQINMIYEMVVSTTSAKLTWQHLTRQPILGPMEILVLF
jgi:hypothetical protein